VIEQLASESATAARTATFQGKERTQAKNFPFPKSVEEYKRRLFDHSFVDVVTDIGFVGTDFGEYFWANRRLGGKLERSHFLDDEPRVQGGGTLVFSPGLLSWEGLEPFKRQEPWKSMGIFNGTYDNMEDYFKGVGMKVKPVFLDSGLTIGDVDGTVEEMRRLIDASEPPTVLMGQSFGGLAAKEFVRRYPQMAKHLEGIISIDAPMPTRVNSVVEGLFVAFNGDESFKRVGAMIEFLSSNEADKFNFISVRAENQNIIDGPDIGEVIEVPAGHSAMCSNIESLRKVVQVINKTRRQAKNRHKFADLLSNSYPLVTVSAA